MQGKVCIVAHVTAAIGQAGADALVAQGATAVVGDRSFTNDSNREACAKTHSNLEVSATLDPEKLADSRSRSSTFQKR